MRFFGVLLAVGAAALLFALPVRAAAEPSRPTQDRTTNSGRICRLVRIRRAEYANGVIKALQSLSKALGPQPSPERAREVTNLLMANFNLIEKDEPPVPEGVCRCCVAKRQKTHANRILLMTPRHQSRPLQCWWHFPARIGNDHSTIKPRRKAG
jgi:hypothetical protein